MDSMETVMIREPGLYRVHLVSGEDWITIFLPLDAEGLLDRERTGGPYLLKALWDSNEYYGELHARQGDHRIEWGADAPDSLTDLLMAPLRGIGTGVRVWESDDRHSEVRTYRVRGVFRL
jgi:hypothetical protein